MRFKLFLGIYIKKYHFSTIAARVRRAPPAAEPGARDISDQLPFLEYELHKLLLAKLRMQVCISAHVIWVQKY